jgi:hypothetical protein
MSDWLARISGSGVVWYNGFQSDAEMNLYRWASAAQGNDPNATAPDAPKLARITTGRLQSVHGLDHGEVYAEAAGSRVPG